ncbi:zinc-ribbon domain-containing protein [Streptomyces sp. NPDC005500]|uniref:zinc-ribbon domain-containing protein n=1 Tax=Streptomyces sp. NPDC005500 TaxID=3155007 RepID=UPI0033A9FA0C
MCTSPTCARAGRNVPPGLLVDTPELLAQVDPDVAQADLVELPTNSLVRLKWRCSRGHSWETRVRHRAIAGSGCPQCARRRRASALPDTRPDLAGSHNVAWEAQVHSRVSVFGATDTTILCRLTS